MTILRHVIQIHQAGVELCDMKAEHVVCHGGGYRVIDFSVAESGHVCVGFPGCEELSETVKELGLQSGWVYGIQMELWISGAGIVGAFVVMMLCVWVVQYWPVRDLDTLLYMSEKSRIKANV